MISLVSGIVKEVGAKHGLEQILTVFCLDWDVSNYLVSSVAFYTPVFKPTYRLCAM